MKHNIDTEEVVCNLCGSASYELVTTGREHEYSNTTPDTFNVVRCTECGLVYLNPRPAISELPTIYPEDYYAYTRLKKLELEGDEGDRRLAGVLRKRSVELFRRYSSLFKDHPGPLRILDVGCGDGVTLSYWTDVFEQATETFGVEMNAQAAAMATERGHTVYTGRFEVLDLPPNHFDLITSFHVIEHVSDPLEFLRKIADSLKPGGAVLIDTPNIDTVDFRWFKNQHWGGYHFPRHWNLYDKDTLEKLAGRAGFMIERVDYYSTAVFWVWTFHSLTMAGFGRPLADLLFPPVTILAKGNLWNLILLTVFTLLDWTLLALTGKTSTMRALLRLETKVEP